MSDRKQEDKTAPGISHGVGDLVLVKWNDGMVYFAKIKRIDHRLRKCVVVFDDKSTDEADFSQIHSVDETTTDIICIKCKHDDSDAPNEIVLCDSCGIGFHQLCHVPPIPASAVELDQPWQCTYCVKKLKNPYLTESIDVIQTLFDGDGASGDEDEEDMEEGDEEVVAPSVRGGGEVMRRGLSVDQGRHAQMVQTVSTQSDSSQRGFVPHTHVGPGRRRKGRRASEMSVSRNVNSGVNKSGDLYPRMNTGRGGKRKRLEQSLGLKKRRASTVQTHTLSVKRIPLPMPTRKMPQVFCGEDSNDDSDQEEASGSPEIKPLSSRDHPRSLRVSLTIPPSLESSPAPPSASSHQPFSPSLLSPPAKTLASSPVEPSSEHSYVTGSSNQHSPTPSLQPQELDLDQRLGNLKSPEAAETQEEQRSLASPTNLHDLSGSHISDDVFADNNSGCDKPATAPPYLTPKNDFPSSVCPPCQSLTRTTEASSEKSIYTSPPPLHTKTVMSTASQDLAIPSPPKVSPTLVESHGSTICESSYATGQPPLQTSKVKVAPGITQLKPVKHMRTSLVQHSSGSPHTPPPPLSPPLSSPLSISSPSTIVSNVHAVQCPPPPPSYSSAAPTLIPKTQNTARPPQQVPVVTAAVPSLSSAVQHHNSTQVSVVQPSPTYVQTSPAPLVTTASSINTSAEPIARRQTAIQSNATTINTKVNTIQSQSQHKVVQHAQPQAWPQSHIVRQPPPLQAQVAHVANSSGLPVSLARISPHQQEVPIQRVTTHEIQPSASVNKVQTSLGQPSHPSQQRTVITSGTRASPMVSVVLTPTTISATGEVATVYTLVPASHVKGNHSPVVTYTNTTSPSSKEVVYSSMPTAVDPHVHQQHMMRAPATAVNDLTSVVHTSTQNTALASYSVPAVGQINHQEGGVVMMDSGLHPELVRAQRKEMILQQQQPLNSNGNATKSYAIVNTAPVTVHNVSRTAPPPAPPLHSQPPPPPLHPPKYHSSHSAENHGIHNTVYSQQRPTLQQPRHTPHFLESPHSHPHPHPPRSDPSPATHRPSPQIPQLREMPPLRSHVVDVGIDTLQDETSSELADHLRKLSHRYGKEFECLGKEKLMEIFHDAWKKFQGNGRKYDMFVKQKKLVSATSIEMGPSTPAVVPPPAPASPVVVPVQRGRHVVQGQQQQYIAVNGSTQAVAVVSPATSPIPVPSRPSSLPPLAPITTGANYVYAAYTSPTITQQRPVIVTGRSTPTRANIVEVHHPHPPPPPPPPLSSSPRPRSHQIHTSGVFVPPPSTKSLNHPPPAQPVTMQVHVPTSTPSTAARPPPSYQRILKPKPVIQQNSPQIFQSRGSSSSSTSSLSSSSSSSSAILIQRPIVAPSEQDIVAAAAATVQPRRQTIVGAVTPIVARTQQAEIVSPRRRNSTNSVRPSHACARCGKNATYLCSGCHLEWYCSRDCQLKAWDLHAEHCKA